MASVFDVAEFFIQAANGREDDQMTNLKLNKMLYYAQGACLARTGRPLFAEPIEAWNFGPVVPEVYHKYKGFERNPIISSQREVGADRFEEEELEAVLDVLREYGQFTGAKLVTLTHRQGTPWEQARTAGMRVIAPESIRAYFTEEPVARLGERLCQETVGVLPEDWYDAAEDEEWERYLG